MKSNFLSLCACVTLAAAVGAVSPSVHAQHGGGGGHPGGGGFGHGGYHGGWHGGGPGWWGWGLGLGLGWEAAYLAYPYPGYYYPYPDYYYYYPESPPVVVAPQSPAPPVNWYYCESAKEYYPRVAQCPEAWRLVPAVPPGSAR